MPRLTKRQSAETIDETTGQDMVRQAVMNFLKADLELSIRKRLQQQTLTWPTMQQIQVNLVELIGTELKKDPDTLLITDILVDMLDVWETHCEKDGEHAAFKQVFILLYHRCSEIFDYHPQTTVMGEEIDVIWDPLSDNYMRWRGRYRIQPKPEKLLPVSNQLYNRVKKEAMLLLLPRLFTRTDFTSMGLVSDTKEPLSFCRITELLSTPMHFNVIEQPRELNYGG